MGKYNRIHMCVCVFPLNFFKRHFIVEDNMKPKHKGWMEVLGPTGSLIQLAGGNAKWYIKSL